MKNPYESGAQKAIPAVLVYLKNKGRILMLHRTGRGAADHHDGKWNGLGGKLELGESIFGCAGRETAEECGLKIVPERFSQAGFLYFPNFKAQKNEDWMVWVFICDISDFEAAQVGQKSSEGILHWIEESKMLELNLWPGDREFLPEVLKGRNFHGTFWYSGQNLDRFEIR